MTSDTGSMTYPHLQLTDNPFIPIPPVRGYDKGFRKLFTSRSSEVDQICRLASGPRGLFVIAPFGGGKTVVLLEALSRMREAGALPIYASFEREKGFRQVLLEAVLSLDIPQNAVEGGRHQTLRQIVQSLCNTGRKVILAVDDLDRANDIAEVKQVTDDVRDLLGDGASVIVTGQPFGVTFDLHTSAGGVFHGVTIPEFTAEEFRELLEKYLRSVHASASLPVLHPFDTPGVEFICHEMAAAKMTPRLFNFAVSELIENCEASVLTFISCDTVMEKWPKLAQRAVKSLKPIQLRHLEVILKEEVVSEDTPKAIAALGGHRYAEFHEVQNGVLRSLVEKNLVYVTKEQGKDQYRLTPHAAAAVADVRVQSKPMMDDKGMAASFEFSSIIELVATDKLEEALSAIKGEGLPAPEKISNRIVMQSGRLARNTRSFNDGRITQEHADVERNRIAESLLGLIRELEMSSEPPTQVQTVTNAELLAAARQLETGLAQSHLGGPSKFEVVHGINNLKSITWIELGVRASRSVCRILIPSPTGTKFGTGFLVGLRCVMTNNHVIGSIEEAKRAKIEFNYQLSPGSSAEPTVRYDLDPDTLFHSDSKDKLDYSLVAVKADLSKPALEKWGVLTLNADAEPIPHELMAVIQHPNGQVKQIVLTSSTVVQAKAPFLHYTSDTMGGSSGSPVFNDLWQVVAIHHAAGPMIGGVPTNEGILMSSIRLSLGTNWPEMV